MRLIDADALKEQCFKFADDVPRSAMAFAQGQINCAPTIDAVPVVRCKECKEWSELLLDRLPAGVGDCRCNMMTTDAHFFCGYGDRKDGDG